MEISGRGRDGKEGKAGTSRRKGRGVGDDNRWVNVWRGGWVMRRIVLGALGDLLVAEAGY
jgi:hypothetical protein